jgi:hypothetical protein
MPNNFANGIAYEFIEPYRSFQEAGRSLGI